MHRKFMAGIVAVGLLTAAVWAVREDSRAPRTPISSEDAGPASAMATRRRIEDIAHPPARDDSTPAVTIEALDQALAQAAPGERDLVLGDMLPGLLAVQPSAAARFAEQQTDHYLRDVSLRLVAQHWAAIDSEAATAWAASLPDAVEREAAFDNVALALAQTDPAAALGLRERLSSGNDPIHDPTLAALAEQWAVRDFGAAASWVRARDDTPQRDDMLARLTFIRAQDGAHEAAAQFALENISNPRRRAEVLAMVAQHWAVRDLPAATQWARDLDPVSRVSVESEIDVVLASRGAR